MTGFAEAPSIWLLTLTIGPDFAFLKAILELNQNSLLERQVPYRWANRATHDDVLVQLFHHLLSSRMQHTEYLSPCEVLDHASGFRPPLHSGGLHPWHCRPPFAAKRRTTPAICSPSILSWFACAGMGCKPISPDLPFGEEGSYLRVETSTQPYDLPPSRTAPHGEAQTRLIYPCGWERVGATSLWAGHPACWLKQPILVPPKRLINLTKRTARRVMTPRGRSGGHPILFQPKRRVSNPHLRLIAGILSIKLRSMAGPLGQVYLMITWAVGSSTPLIVQMI